MGRYFIIGTGGYPTYLSVDGIVGIMQDTRNTLTTLLIYYSNGKIATITLNRAVVIAEEYKWANWFIEKFASAHNSITTAGEDWETVAEATTILTSFGSLPAPEIPLLESIIIFSVSATPDFRAGSEASIAPVG